MHPQGTFKLVLRKTLSLQNEQFKTISQWVLEKQFHLPFVPFEGLTIKEPSGKVHVHADGKWTPTDQDAFMPWKIRGEIQYVNIGHDGFFLVEDSQNAREGDKVNNPEGFLKMWESWGWKVVKAPHGETKVPKEAVVVKHP